MLRGPWSSGVSEYLRAHDLHGLYLNHARGWTDQSVRFLESVPDLRLLSVISGPIRDVSAIGDLTDLHTLNLSVHREEDLDLGRLDQLRKCFVSAGPGDVSVFQCPSLRYLYLDELRSAEWSGLSSLTNLECLTIGNSSFCDLELLGHMTRLRKLVLLNCRQLASLRGLEQLATLEWLTIDGSARVSDISPLRQLRGLRILQLNNVKDLPSLHSISELYGLESLAFFGSTNIVDGDLGVIEKLPDLSLLGFAGRRHYSHVALRKWNWSDFGRDQGPLLKPRHTRKR